MTSSRLSERLAGQRRRGDSGNKWIRVAMAVLATIGVIDTGSITLKKWGVIASLSCSSQDFFGCNGCEKVLSSGDETLVRIVKALPEESWGRLKEIFAEADAG
mgnify:CR=1 FL=1